MLAIAVIVIVVALLVYIFKYKAQWQLLEADLKRLSASLQRFSRGVRSFFAVDKKRIWIALGLVIILSVGIGVYYQLTEDLDNVQLVYGENLLTDKCGDPLIVHVVEFPVDPENRYEISTLLDGDTVSLVSLTNINRYDECRLRFKVNFKE